MVILDSERRTSTRSLVNFEVLMYNGIEDAFILQAVNASKAGIYVLSEGQPMPILGSVVQIQLNDDAQSPLLDMIIKRIDVNGIGLQFLKRHL